MYVSSIKHPIQILPLYVSTLVRCIICMLRIGIFCTHLFAIRYAHETQSWVKVSNGYVVFSNNVSVYWKNIDCYIGGTQYVNRFIPFLYDNSITKNYVPYTIY